MDPNNTQKITFYCILPASFSKNGRIIRTFLKISRSLPPFAINPPSRSLDHIPIICFKFTTHTIGKLNRLDNFFLGSKPCLVWEVWAWLNLFRDSCSVDQTRNFHSVMSKNLIELLPWRTSLSFSQLHKLSNLFSLKLK